MLAADGVHTQAGQIVQEVLILAQRLGIALGDEHLLAAQCLGCFARCDAAERHDQMARLLLGDALQAVALYVLADVHRFYTAQALGSRKREQLDLAMHAMWNR